MKIVVAPDSFKGSLTAFEVGNAIKKGLLRGDPRSIVKVIPMADGGEGTLQCLIDATGGRFVKHVVTGPMGNKIESGFGILGDGITCVIEMAMSSGLYLVDPAERNPLVSTTYGFGELIQAGLDHGCRHFILGIGGSATNDAGAGMLQALGFELIDQEGEQIGFGELLAVGSIANFPLGTNADGEKITLFSGFAHTLFTFIGTPVTALFIGLLIAIFGLLPKRNEETLTKWMSEGLLDAAIIIMITGAGGALGSVIKAN